jgi:hypothetical protein
MVNKVAILNFLTIWRTRGNFKPNFKLCYLNMAAIVTIWRTRVLTLNLLVT